MDYAEHGLEGVHSADKIINTALSFGYGLTDNLTLSVRLLSKGKVFVPVMLKTIMPRLIAMGGSSGLDDLLLFGQYRFFKIDDVDVALLLGTKAPTGETDEKDNTGQLFKTEYQSGSGSWDFLIGSAVSYVEDRFGYVATAIKWDAIIELNGETRCKNTISNHS